MSMKIHKVENKVLLLGDNEFETGVITVPAGATVKAGTFLKRASGKFAVVTNTAAETPIAVVAVDITNDGSASADLSFRPCIKGKVRADMLNVNGTPTTDEQNDIIRNYGIIAVKIYDLSRLDNQ